MRDLMDRKRKALARAKGSSAAAQSRRGADDALPPAGTDALGGGLKKSTVGTTLYLLPDESWRLKQLAVTLRISMHDLILRGLDKVLEENGQEPVKRYAPSSSAAEKGR